MSITIYIRHVINPQEIEREEGERLVVQQRIIDYIRENDKKRTAIADKAGIKRDRFSLLMNLKTELRADELESICKALGTSPNEFVHVKSD